MLLDEKSHGWLLVTWMYAKIFAPTVQLTMVEVIFSSCCSSCSIVCRGVGHPEPTLYTSPHCRGVWSRAASTPATVSLTKVKSRIREWAGLKEEHMVYTHTHTLTHILTLTHAHTHSYTPSHTHTLTLTLTHPGSKTGTGLLFNMFSANL